MAQTKLEQLTAVANTKREATSKYKELIEELIPEHSAKELATAAGVTVSVIAYYRKKAGLVGSSATGATSNAGNADLPPKVIEIMRELHAEGTSWGDIADALNDAGFKTSRGKAFQSANVRYIGLLHGIGQITLSDDSVEADLSEDQEG